MNELLLVIKLKPSRALVAFDSFIFPLTGNNSGAGNLV